MIGYQRRGLLPRKPHSVLRSADDALLYEHCFTRDGFDGPFSILYHRRQAQSHGQGTSHEVLWSRTPAPPSDEPGLQSPLRRQHFQTGQVPSVGTPTTGRTVLVYNEDITVGVLRPGACDGYAFANGDGDDLFYIHRGGGELLSWFGRLRFEAGDYLMVPRAVAHRFVLDEGEQYWFWMECRSGMRLPRQYRNPVGQLRMDAPYSHRDFRVPELPDLIDETHPDRLVTKRRDRFTQHATGGDIFDVVGWDGTVYPFAFPILNFSPRSGQYHLPPTVHGTFATAASLICSFVPRMVDFGEGAIPCPYPHSNVDVDEVIFYCDGDFTSRRGINAGSVSLHPAGVPHGPHGDAYEASIGSRETRELAVMIDTFQPVTVAPAGRRIEVSDYDESWAPDTTQGG